MVLADPSQHPLNMNCPRPVGCGRKRGASGSGNGFDPERDALALPVGCPLTEFQAGIHGRSPGSLSDQQRHSDNAGRFTYLKDS